MGAMLAQTMVLAPVAAPTVASPRPRSRQRRPIRRMATSRAERNGRSRISGASTQPVEKRESRKRAIAVIAGIVLALLLLGVTGYLVAQPRPTLALSAYTVFPGDAIFATASNLPANQVGELQLLSAVHLFPFRSDANGKVTAISRCRGDIGRRHTYRQALLGVAVPASVTFTWSCLGPGPTHPQKPHVATLARPQAHRNSDWQSTPCCGNNSRPRASPVPAPVQLPAAVPSPKRARFQASVPSPSPKPAPLPAIITLSSTHFRLLDRWERRSFLVLISTQGARLRSRLSRVGQHQSDGEHRSQRSGSFSQSLTVKGGLGVLVLGPQQYLLRSVRCASQWYRTLL